MSQFGYLTIVILYVLVMLAVGYWCMRRTKDVGDFFLGGRSIGPWMSAFAYGTTYFSAVLFIGYAGKLGWSFGIHTMWIVVGNTLVGTLLAWKLLAGRTREMTARLNAITMPEFLRARYDSKTLQVISALVVFFFLVPYSASVLMGMSYLFEMTLKIDYTHALYLLTALTAVYLVMGGYFAVAVSDFIRGIVEFGGVMLMVYLLATKVGGFGHATQTLLTDPTAAPGITAPAKVMGSGPLEVVIPGALTLAALVLITSFGPWALPQMVQKFYSIRSKADVTRAMVIAGIFSIFMAFGAYYSGALTHLFYPNGQLPADLLDPAKGQPIWDKIMPHFITNSGLPELLVLVIVLMVFSASMSSLSSLVLVSSSAIGIDIFGAFRTPDVDKGVTSILRLLFGAAALVAGIFGVVFIVMLGNGFFFHTTTHVMQYFWSAFGCLAFAAFMYRLARADLGDLKLMLIRTLCAVFVGLSLWIALKPPTFIVNLMVMSWSTLAGVFLAPYLYGLFWKRATRAGVFAGVFSGLACAVILFPDQWGWGQAGVPVAGAITMFVPMIVVPLVSLITPPPPKALVDAAFTDAASSENVKEGAMV